MARSVALHLRGRRSVSSPDSVLAKIGGDGHGAPRASRPLGRLRRCAWRSLDPCSRGGLGAAVQRRTCPSLQINERILTGTRHFLLDGGAQIRRVRQRAPDDGNVGTRHAMHNEAFHEGAGWWPDVRGLSWGAKDWDAPGLSRHGAGGMTRAGVV